MRVRRQSFNLTTKLNLHSLNRRMGVRTLAANGAWASRRADPAGAFTFLGSSMSPSEEDAEDAVDAAAEEEEDGQSVSTRVWMLFRIFFSSTSTLVCGTYARRAQL